MFDNIYNRLESKTKKRFEDANTEICNVSLNPQLLKNLLNNHQSMNKQEIENILNTNMETILEMYSNNVFQGIEAIQIINLFRNHIVMNYIKYYMMDENNKKLSKIVTNIYFNILLMILEERNSQEELNNCVEIIRVSNMNDFIRLHQIDMNVNVTYIALIVGMTAQYGEEDINNYIKQLYNSGIIKMPPEYMRYIHDMMIK